MKSAWVDLATLAGASYGRRSHCRGWQRGADHAPRGLRASAWRRGGQVVVTLRGTASLGEAWQDYLLLRRREPHAWRRARRFIASLATDPGRTLLVGHSIGGAFAHFLSLELGLPAVTFNAPGIVCVTGRQPGAPITNLCAREDWIWRLSGPGLGRTIEVPVADGRRPRVRAGPRGVAAALRAGARREGCARFVVRSLRLHAVDLLRAALARDVRPARTAAGAPGLSCCDVGDARSSPPTRTRSRRSESRAPCAPPRWSPGA